MNAEAEEFLNHRGTEAQRSEKKTGFSRCLRAFVVKGWGSELFQGTTRRQPHGGSESRPSLLDVMFGGVACS